MRLVASAIAAIAILGLIASLTVEVAAMSGRAPVDPHGDLLTGGSLMALIPIFYGYLRPNGSSAPRGPFACLGELPDLARVLLGAAWVCGALGSFWLSVDLYIRGFPLPATSVLRSHSGSWAMFFAGTAVHALARAIAPARRNMPFDEAGRSGEPHP
ncbi:MAG TPA: hypothetical protein VGM37_07170 [Armatimonadota bacterium]|jgi:hypothetical protein